VLWCPEYMPNTIHAPYLNVLRCPEDVEVLLRVESFLFTFLC
jgi:hypothetical protein